MREQSGASRILIVDDDVGTTDSFSLILSHRGFVVDTAATGQEGLQRARHRSWDLLLSDLFLPDLSGIDVVRSLRDEGINVPAIIMTAFATTSSAMEAIRLGVIDYVEKPLFEDDVVRAVETALAGRLGAAVPTPNPPALPAIERWTALVLCAVGAPYDPRTLEEWAKLGCIARATLEKRCEAAGVGPKASLDLARVLRAVRQARRTGAAPDLFLDADPRTLRRLLSAAGLCAAGFASFPVPTPLQLLRTQRILSTTVVLEALGRALAHLQ